MMRRLARLRVPLGFLCAAVAFWLARPAPWSIVAGGAIAVVGEFVRVWAAGHIEKGREITRSGPYRFLRHPLYVGSVLMAVGFAVAALRPLVAVIVAVYLGATYTAAIRTEEAALDEKFDGAYAAYRAGLGGAVARRFSLARARANREYRSVAGLAAAFGLLWVRMIL